MSDEHDRLESLGISVISDAEDPIVRGECMRIARRLQSTRHKIIGFIPASAKVAVPALAIQIGMALVELTGATVAVVDANVRYPALSEVARGDSTDSDDSVFSTRWLKGSLALLAPPAVERSGEVVPQLARLLLEGVDLFEHVLVDLTGFDLLGEHASAAACMDAVLLVGRATETHEADLLGFKAEMPTNRFLGVLLLG